MKIADSGYTTGSVKNPIHNHGPVIDSESAHSHDYRSVEKRKLKLAMIVTGVVMVLEIAGGFLTNSLALLSDAGHMFTHLFALGVALFAIVIASKDPCHHRTFGLYRAEILAALFNSIFLFGVTALILYEGIKRLLNPEEVLALQMLLVAGIGLVANLASVLILRGSHRDDINVRGAFLHVLADTLSSVVILIGGVVITFTNLNVIDPILSIGISILIFVWAQKLFRESVNILLEAAPKGIDTDIISDAIRREIPKVKDIYDMHIWVITSGMYSFTAHVAVDEPDLDKQREIIEKVNRLLREKYRIEHTTIQIHPSTEPNQTCPWKDSSS